ncbi:MAG: hypothetical protein MK160_11505 [Rhodobacteraceae bacterium]|nr:hypothetical protein [Paracoccaceae bacterium]
MDANERAREEVRVFEYNAKEGVRAVAFAWFLRRVALPLGAFLVLVMIGAFAANGVLAGTLSIAIFGGPLVALFLFTTGQGRKVVRYWIRDKREQDSQEMQE